MSEPDTGGALDPELPEAPERLDDPDFGVTALLRPEETYRGAGADGGVMIERYEERVDVEVGVFSASGSPYDLYGVLVGLVGSNMSLNDDTFFAVDVGFIAVDPGMPDEVDAAENVENPERAEAGEGPAE